MVGRTRGIWARSPRTRGTATGNRHMPMSRLPPLGSGVSDAGAIGEERRHDGTKPTADEPFDGLRSGGRTRKPPEKPDRQTRVKPAVFFGGKTRIIDFALSNALNSGIRKMSIATQYKAHSLIRHCQRGWSFFRAERNEYLDILPASQRVDENAVVSRHRRRGVPEHRHRRQLRTSIYVIILAGDHIYKMDYEVMLRQHVETAGGRDNRLPHRARAMEASAFGVMAIDATTGSPASLKSPRIRRARRMIRGRDARLNGHLCLQVELPARPAVEGCRGQQFQPRLRRRPDPRNRQERQGDGAPVRPRAASNIRPDGAPAYWRDVGHHRCLSGRPISI